MANDDLATSVIALASQTGAGLGRILPVDPFTLSEGLDAAAPYVLGAEYIYGANKFRFVKEVANAVPLVDGSTVFHDDSGVRGEVTADYSENLGDALRPVGVAVHPIGDGKYGWILVEGEHPDADNNGDDDIVAGNDLIATAVDHGLLNAGARTLATGVGIALSDDVDGANTVRVAVNCSANW